MKDQNMIETNHLKIYPASRVQMEAVIAAETDDEMKLAYTEMLCGATAHPEQWERYAIWMIELYERFRLMDEQFYMQPKAK